MGWDSLIGADRKQSINDKRRMFEKSGYKILGESGSLHAHFFALEKGEDSFVDIVLIQGSKNDIYLKDVSEDMGPFTFNCPLKLLELTKGFPNSDFSKQWREGVRAYHEKRLQTFEPGEQVTVYGKPYTVLRKEKRSFVIQAPDGKIYKSGPSKIEKEGTK